MLVDWDADDGNVEWLEPLTEAAGADSGDESVMLGLLCDEIEADPEIWCDLDPEVRDSLDGWL